MLRYSRRTAIGLMASAAALSSVSTSRASEVQNGTLRLAAALDNASWDPGRIQNGNQAQLWGAVYDTLLRMEPDTSITGNLATSFAYNDDLTVLTLHLRDDVKFSDGTPFNAAAVRANIENLQGAAGQSTFMVAAVESVVVVDDFIVELHLNDPDPALTTYLSMAGGAMGSPAALGTEAMKTMPIGSGPYVLDADWSQTGVRYGFKRNPDYWNPKAYPFEELRVYIMQDLTARLNALRSGQIDAMSGDGGSVAEAKAAGLIVHTSPLDRLGITIGDRAGVLVPALGDARVRQAINHAIDAQGILDAIQLGFGSRTTQIFNPKSTAFVETLTDAYPYDPERAKALLSEAGYADGFDLVMPENPTYRWNTIVQQQLAEVGVRVTYEKVVAADYIPAVRSGKYAMWMQGLSTGDPWWDLQKQVETTSPYNVFDTMPDELAGLISQAQHSSDAEYGAAMKGISEYLVREAWFDIWFLADAIYITTPEISVNMHPMNVVPYIGDISPAK